MGLLFADGGGGGDFKTKAEADWLEQVGCKACPLNSTPGKIDATGSTSPEIYVLGEAAGRDEEDQRKQFVGKAGKLLRSLLPRPALPLVRWNNVLNCHPPGNRDPLPQEIACCRPRLLADLAKYKPRVIWGFGEFPLKWATGMSGIGFWRGRRTPVQIGDRTYWFYPFYHPSWLNRIARGDREFGSEEERMTLFDLERAFAELDTLEEPVVHTTTMIKANVECITDLGQIRNALQWAARQPSVGLDYETNRKRPYYEGAKILTISVGTQDKSYAFPLHHPEAGYSKKQIAEIDDLWYRFLMHAPCEKMVHNLAFELEWSGVKYGAETIRAQKWLDTNNQAVVLDERSDKKKKAGPMSLEFLIQQYFGFNIKKVSNVDRKNLENTPLSTVLLYNGIDSKYHHALGIKQAARIEHEGMQEAARLAQRRVPTVVLSQIKGVPIDQVMVKKLTKKYGDKIDKARAVIAKLEVVRRFERQRGREFNPFSTMDDLIYVFDRMLRCDEVAVEVYDKKKKKKREKLSTDEVVLQAIIKNKPGSDAEMLARAVIDLRSCEGTKSKYIDALRIGSDNCVVYPDGLVHTNFNTFFAETGRLSSDEPNLQNFPKRNAETKEVRKSIAARLGRCVLSVDYGQIEARVVAMSTHDKVFVKALWERFDVHMDWAERLAYAYPERVGGKRMIKDKKAMKDFRTDIKNQWTFPLFFGAQDSSVSNYLNIPLEIIRPQVREFWRMFPATKKWQDDTVASYEENGYVECMTGRRRRGPLTVNQIINTPIQGTAAEIVLDAMGRLSEAGDPELQPEINIHDDLTYLDIPLKRADDIAEKVIDVMLKVPFKWAHIVPITAELSMGKNWCEIEEIGTYSSDQW